MAIQPDDIARIAELARVRIPDADIPEVTRRLGGILDLLDQLQAAKTDGVEPMANPLDATQTLREDIVTEVNRREAFQAVAPTTEDGLYLVPRVIE